MKLNNAIVFTGTAENVLQAKSKIEDVITEEGCKLIFVKTSPRNLYIYSEEVDE